MDKYLGYSIDFQRRFYNGKCFTTTFVRKEKSKGLWIKLLDAKEGSVVPETTVQDAITKLAFKQGVNK